MDAGWDGLQKLFLYIRMEKIGLGRSFAEVPPRR